MILPLYIEHDGEHTHMGTLDCSRCDVRVGREWNWAVCDDLSRWGSMIYEGEMLPSVEYRRVIVRFTEFASRVHNLDTGEPGRRTFWLAAVLVRGSYADLQRLAEFRADPPRPVSRMQFRDSMERPPHLTVETHDREPPFRCIPRRAEDARSAQMVADFLYHPTTRERIEEHLARELRNTIFDLSPMDTPFLDRMRRGPRQRVGDYGTSADTTPPEDAKPLAPLPDWLKEVDSILAENTPQPGEP